MNTHRTYHVIYHIGDTLNLRTKVLEGRAALTQNALTITGPSPVEVPVRELRGAELFRLHGLGRFIRAGHRLRICCTLRAVRRLFCMDQLFPDW
jgi:hypothetical protein